MPDRISIAERSDIIGKMADEVSSTNIKSPHALIVGSGSMARHVFGEVEGVCSEVPLPTIAVKGQMVFPERVCGIGVLLKHWGLAPWVAYPAGSGEISTLQKDYLSQRDITSLELKAAHAQVTKYVLRIFSECHQHAHIEMREEIQPASTNEIQQANHRLTSAAERSQVLCIVDQDDVTLSEPLLIELFSRAQESGAKVFYEPRSRRLIKNSKIDVTKINGAEAKQQFGLAVDTEQDALRAAEMALDRTQSRSVVLTRGKHGILVSQRDKSQIRSIFVEPKASKLFDLVSAGDIVTTGLVYCIAKGYSLVQAACFAIAAVEIGISRFHDKRIDLQEILRRSVYDPSSRTRTTKRTSSYSAA